MIREPFDGSIGQTMADSEPWWPQPTAPKAGSPNVVMVVLDDVGFAHLGCYGSRIRTPHIDRIAAEGLRYTNFHTTALCSPTRACLLTGRNHHSVGMSSVANWNLGFPGSRGAVTHRAATLSEILRSKGYNTMAVGKWHLTPGDEQTPAGPFDQWPLQRGFERYYGFLDAYTSQWRPELTVDNHRIETPESPDYHLTEDLVDHSIEFLRNQVSWAPDKPFFLYLALGACHEPHHAPQSFIDSYKGVFDDGWDQCRDEVLSRQIDLGLVPDDTVLPPRNPGVQAWSDLGREERRLFARLQQAFAGMLEHADHHLGRLFEFLVSSGQRDNTILVVVSDNGASQEGSAVGTMNTMRYHNGLADNLEDNLRQIDLIGRAEVYNNYPLGWAMAGNTPCKWYKQNTHGGGIRDPLIISWPIGIRARGGIRTQFHHATDIMPTLLEAIEIEAPSCHDGVEQIPVEGVGMGYTFEAPHEATRKDVQYFEMLGHRGIYADGWKAVTRHEAGTSFDDDTWELYHLSEDFSESEDLAATEPEKLRAMIALWWEEADRYQVLPLDDRVVERWLLPPAPGSVKARDSFVLYRGISHVGPDAAPDLKNVSHTIKADIFRSEGDDGVLVAHGGHSGGYSLFVKSARLVYVYNCAGTYHRIEAEKILPLGLSSIRMEFVKTGALSGRVKLFADDELIGCGELPETLPYTLSVEGIDIGEDRLTPVAQDYTSPFRFEGTLERIEIGIGSDRTRDGAGEMRSTLAKQ
ncbi:MAG: arylsulfatase [Actinobacteria bacterium]|nr:arylsulfatase [Actinomycetota bacterium]